MTDWIRATGLLLVRIQAWIARAVASCRTFRFDPYRVVRDVVEDGVGDGVATEPAVPFLGRQLCFVKLK